MTINRKYNLTLVYLLSSKKNVMKKIMLLFALAILNFACKTQSPVGTSLDKRSEVAIKGNWTISEVTYPGSEYIKVNSFDVADSKCFVGSNWKFVSNNNSGTMALTKGDCIAFETKITWLINKDGLFVMKFVEAGEKAKRVKEGVVLTVANQTDTSFQLIDRVNIGGKSIAIIYQFQKSI